MLRMSCLLAVMLMAVAGCSGRSLYHYHRTVVGVDISGNVSESSPSGRLTLGYSRRLIVAMPDAIQTAIAKAGKNEAEATAEKSDKDRAEPRVKANVVDLPPTVFCTQVKASLGGASSFREILATGAPATHYAEQVAAEGVLVSTGSRNLVCPQLMVPKPAKKEQD